LEDIYRIDRTSLVLPAGVSYQYKIESKIRPEEEYTLLVDQTRNEESATQTNSLMDHFTARDARYVKLTLTGVAGNGETEAHIGEFRVHPVVGTPPVSIGSIHYRTIQDAINEAHANDVIVLQPGVYEGPHNGCVNLRGKDITITSIDPNDQRVVSNTRIKGNAKDPAVSFAGAETSHCALVGLTLSNARPGIFCTDASPTVSKCRIIGHHGNGVELVGSTQIHFDHCVIAGNMEAGIAVQAGQRGQRFSHNAPYVVNCTIVENLGPAIISGKPIITNSILFGNDAIEHNQIEGHEAAVTFCDVQGGWPAGLELVVNGNIDSDPGFVVPGHWEDGLWTAGDYHLKSQTGSWDPEQLRWVSSLLSSPCIDAGDPESNSTDEPMPNGGRINQGAFGGTDQASMSP
jgi:hypothetical protein